MRKKGMPGTQGSDRELSAQDEKADRTSPHARGGFEPFFREPTDAVFIIDTESGRILHASRTAERIWGYTGKGFVDKHFSVLLEGTPDLSAQSLLETTRAQGGVSQSLSLRRADGSVCPVDLTASVIPWASAKAILATFHDVTERVEADEAARRCDAILEAVTFAVEHFLRKDSWRLRLSGALERLGVAAEVSRVYVAEHQMPEETAIQPLAWEWAVPSEGMPPLPSAGTAFPTACISKRWEKLLRKGNVVRGNLGDFPSGERRPLRARNVRSALVVPIHVAGEWWGIIGFEECRRERQWSDPEVNALKVVSCFLGAVIACERVAGKERQLREHLVQVDKMKSLGLLVSGVAHEISNPNHYITSNARTLRKIWKDALRVLDEYYKHAGNFIVGGIDYSELRERVPSLCTRIIEGSDRIKMIVARVRDFARVAPAEPAAAIDVNAVVGGAVALLADMIAKTTQRFSVRYAPDIPPIRGNPQRIEQVVVNLVQNSCQALTSRTQAIAVSTGYDTHEGCVTITVQDEGAGIAAEHIEHVTAPFFTTKREAGSMGLGLAISSGIVHEHGGTLRLESLPGQGATVTVTLPAGRDGTRRKPGGRTG